MGIIHGLPFEANVTFQFGENRTFEGVQNVMASARTSNEDQFGIGGKRQRSYVDLPWWKGHEHQSWVVNVNGQERSFVKIGLII
jgi:hypothetical protein